LVHAPLRGAPATTVINPRRFVGSPLRRLTLDAKARLTTEWLCDPQNYGNIGASLADVIAERVEGCDLLGMTLNRHPNVAEDWRFRPHDECAAESR
jgi:hypothetical protein